MASTAELEREAWAAAHFGDDPRYVLLTTIEAAELVRVKPATIRSWAHRGHLRPLTVDDGRPYYRLSDVLAVDSRMRRLPTPEEVRSIAAEWARHADNTGPV